MLVQEPVQVRTKAFEAKRPLFNLFSFRSRPPSGTASTTTTSRTPHSWPRDSTQKVRANETTLNGVNLISILSPVLSDDSLFLLATCYFRAGRYNEAYDAIKTRGAHTQQNRFLMAKCCQQIGK